MFDAVKDADKLVLTDTHMSQPPGGLGVKIGRTTDRYRKPTESRTSKHYTRRWECLRINIREVNFRDGIRGEEKRWQKQRTPLALAYAIHYRLHNTLTLS